MYEPAWTHFTPGKLIRAQQASTDHAKDSGSMAMWMQHVPITRYPLIAEAPSSFLQDSHIIRCLREPGHPFVQQKPVGGVPTEHIQGVCGLCRRNRGSDLHIWCIGLLSQLLTDPERYVGISKILSTILCAAVLEGPLAGSMKAPLDSFASGWIHN